MMTTFMAFSSTDSTEESTIIPVSQITVSLDTLPSPSREVLKAPLIQKADGSYELHPKVLILEKVSTQEAIDHYTAIKDDENETEELKKYAEAILAKIENDNN